MAGTPSWPPKSPHAALLSSPSGRRKHQQNDMSPQARSAATPSLLDRLRAARADNDFAMGSTSTEEDDDEETIKLQLAAIEAKLKLKKLQQNKARSEAATPTVVGVRSKYLGARDRSVEPNREDDVQVALSPMRRPPTTEPRSPGRVLLGIDKGVTGSDVSLRRARTVASHSRRVKGESISDRSNSRASTFNSVRSGISTSSTRDVHVKSFSERMAETRADDKTKDLRRERLRSSGFALNPAEMDNFRTAAEESRKHALSPTKPQSRPAYTREEVLLASDTAKTDPKTLRKSRSLPGLRTHSTAPPADPSLYEGFSELHLSSRILPHSFLKRTLPTEQYTIYQIQDLLKNITSPAYELPDEVGDFVVFGVIAKKSNPLNQKQKGEEQSAGTNDWECKWDDGSNNQKKFIVLTLTDLKWSLSLYLFGTAVPRYYRLTPGTVVAILNPTIMPPKRGGEDTGAFSLSLNNGEDTVLEIGTAQHLGFCNAVRKDGQECGDWVNSAKTEICEWHLNLQMAKTQSGRMGVNSGSNGFGGGGKGPNNRKNVFDRRRVGIREGEGPRGLLPERGASRFDRYTGSEYYVSSSNGGRHGAPKYRSNTNTAAILDNDDPFVAEGQFSRDREALMQRRMANQEKEREIAKKLTALESGGAGREYLRHKTGEAQSARGEMGSQRSALSTKSNIMRAGTDANRNGKRSAESVRLSPVKKTRFVTEKGIREAGRDSLGVTSKVDDDDDLDIV